MPIGNIDASTATEVSRRELKQKIKALLIEYGYRDIDRIVLNLGENSGVKGGEVTRYI